MQCARKKMLLTLLALGGLGSLMVLGAMGYGYLQATRILESSRPQAGLRSPPVAVEPLSPFNVLLLGVDNGLVMDEYRSRRGLADTIMVFALRPRDRTVYEVSVPRDTRTVVPGLGMTKINAAYAHGGAELSRQVLQDLLAVKIDRVVVIDYTAFVSLVDLVGGVTLEVESDINERYNIGRPIPTGLVRLTGQEAYRYVHARDSDIERVARQQKFLRSLVREVRQKNAYGKVLDYLVEHPTAVVTDFTVDEIIALARHKDEYDGYALQTVLLEGEARDLDGLSYWVVNDKHLAEVRRTLVPANGEGFLEKAY